MKKKSTTSKSLKIKEKPIKIDVPFEEAMKKIAKGGVTKKKTP